MTGGSQISTGHFPMTAAPSNVKNREIAQGGYKRIFELNTSELRVSARALFACQKGASFMSDDQRRLIQEMRKQGMGYKAIARKAKLSRDSVRNYCRWHHMAGYGAAIAAAFGKECVYEDF